MDSDGLEAMSFTHTHTYTEREREEQPLVSTREKEIFWVYKKEKSQASHDSQILPPRLALDDHCRRGQPLPLLLVRDRQGSTRGIQSK